MVHGYMVAYLATDVPMVLHARAYYLQESIGPSGRFVGRGSLDDVHWLYGICNGLIKSTVFLILQRATV